MYKKIDESDIKHFIEIVGESFVFTDKEILNDYGHDETEDLGRR